MRYLGYDDAKLPPKKIVWQSTTREQMNKRPYGNAQHERHETRYKSSLVSALLEFEILSLLRPLITLAAFL